MIEESFHVGSRSADLMFCNAARTTIKIIDITYSFSCKNLSSMSGNWFTLFSSKAKYRRVRIGFAEKLTKMKNRDASRYVKRVY